MSPKMDPDSLAVMLLGPELPTLKELPDWKTDHYPRLAALSSHLGPVALDALAREVKAHFRISTEAFRKEAARKKTERETSENEGATPPLDIYFDEVLPPLRGRLRNPRARGHDASSAAQSGFPTSWRPSANSRHVKSL